MFASPYAFTTPVRTRVVSSASPSPATEAFAASVPTPLACIAFVGSKPTDVTPYMILAAASPLIRRFCAHASTSFDILSKPSFDIPGMFVQTRRICWSMSRKAFTLSIPNLTTAIAAIPPASLAIPPEIESMLAPALRPRDTMSRSAVRAAGATPRRDPASPLAACSTPPILARPVCPNCWRSAGDVRRSRDRDASSTSTI